MDKNTIKYTSREYDPDSKLQYNRARYYDPALGRFITKDPLAYSLNTDYYSTNNLRMSMNLNSCSYGNCNPINNTDPSGLVIVGFAGKFGDPNDPGLGVTEIESKLRYMIPDPILVSRYDQVDDANRFINRWLEVKPKQRPVIMYGHSYGGSAAINLARKRSSWRGGRCFVSLIL
ncbi:MAG: hypothetical protein L6420_01080 [Elusimicrobia bacterium]|nr:hypothetical protein [Elusimicrobiota bacterium]